MKEMLPEFDSLSAGKIGRRLPQCVVVSFWSRCRFGSVGGDACWCCCHLQLVRFCYVAAVGCAHLAFRLPSFADDAFQLYVAWMAAGVLAARCCCSILALYHFQLPSFLHFVLMENIIGLCCKWIIIFMDMEFGWSLDNWFIL
ncbi:unnamed protein product [Lathyrus oleraceus]|uniref:uncharacterized protein LOC127131173 n=1 Tax=Pisum sativum TaxID=3888 RepID=UPI001FC507E0|nr:uncharacterized protein LOC127131173 [Pisum sativum]